MSNPSDWILDADDVIAHLFFAAGSVEEVRMEHDGGTLKGTIRFPDGENEGFLLACPGVSFARFPPVVTLAYEGQGDQYRFESQIREITAEGVRIGFPTVIERKDRRLTRRHPVPPESGLAFRVTGRGARVLFPLFDLSVGGLGLLTMPGPYPKVGELIDGDLLIPGDLPISLRLEVRHLAPQAELVVVGGRFIRMSAGDRSRLVRHLIQWLPQ